MSDKLIVPDQALEKLQTAGTKYKHWLEMDVYEAAQIRMKYLYQNFDHVIISWSSGKDSSTCLELAREAAREAGRLPVEILFLDEEVIYPESIEIAMRHVADPELKIYWVCVPSIYRNACSEIEPDFLPFDPDKKNLWTHQPPDFAVWPSGYGMTDWRVPPSIPKRALIEMWKPQVQKGEKVCMVTGLRARESFVRYAGIMSSGSFLTDKEHGVYHARPIYDWTERDVWWAIKNLRWDYNKAYDKLWRAGASVVTARIAPLFHAEAAMMLRRVMIYWPEWWPYIRRRVRGAHSMAIYSGELHKLRLLPGETWEVAAMRYWENLGSEESRKILWDAIQAKLKKHRSHSSGPMEEVNKCPKCGLCWKTIARACCLDDRQLRILEPYNS